MYGWRKREEEERKRELIVQMFMQRRLDYGVQTKAVNNGNTSVYEAYYAIRAAG